MRVVLLDVLNGTGALPAVAVANVVLVFVLLQYPGVRRIHGATAPAPSAAR